MKGMPAQGEIHETLEGLEPVNFRIGLPESSRDSRGCESRGSASGTDGSHYGSTSTAGSAPAPIALRGSRPTAKKEPSAAQAAPRQNPQANRTGRPPGTKHQHQCLIGSGLNGEVTQC